MGIGHEGHPAAQEYMDQRGKFLGRIVQKGSGRHHLLNTDRNHTNQVLRLLEKVESMVAENRGDVFRVDATLVLSTEVRLHEVREKVAVREATIPTERNLLCEVYKGVLSVGLHIHLTLYVCQSTCPSICLSIHASIHPCISMPIHLSHCLYPSTVPLDHQLAEVRLLLWWSLVGKSTVADTILNDLPGDSSKKRTT